VEREPVLLRELGEDALLLPVEPDVPAARIALGSARSASEERAEPREESAPRRRRWRRRAPAATTAAAAAARTRLYAIALIASDTLCPPKPKEFVNAAFTVVVRA